MSTYSIILNPEAGKGQGRRLLPRVEEGFRSRGARYELLQTKEPGDATRLAAEARGDVIVAVGGDGTVNEIANGLLENPRPLGVLPAGSGNDFIKAIKVPRKLPAALEVLFRGQTFPIDVGFVRTGDRQEGRNSPGRHFVNGVGIGFDAAVAAKTAEIRFLTGLPLYLAAVFQTLGKYEPPKFSMVIDGRRRDSSNLLIAIGNGPCAGGGFYLTPDARIDDGLFDVCLIDPVSIPTILRLMPKVMVGKHQKEKQVKFLRAKEISMTAETRFYVHADGEIVGRDVTSVQVSMREKALTVIGG